MYLIDQPFVSDFLIQTIKENNHKIIATKGAKALVNDNTLNWIAEEEAISTIKHKPHIPLYSNSENALSWIADKLGESERSRQIKILKDKVKFRALIQQIFPNFYFKKIKIEDIQQLSFEDYSFPFVIKPSIGFFSIGVHIIKNKKDWIKAKNELKPDKLKSIFPENVLNTAHFILEEYIQGEEYAIDYYHDQKGDVVLLNIMHHLFSSGTDTSDRVYSTSKEIITRHKTEIEEILGKIGKRLNLKNFPAHAEVRIDKTGKITPIEINPLRFGGWCTTGDLLGVTLGFNAYQCFFENVKPDWDTIFRKKEKKTFSLIVLNNNSGIAPSDILNFNYTKLADDFENTVLIRKLDIHKYPVFGFVFTESSDQNELYDILSADLKKYITSAQQA
jgi:hypothetical protein